ncbi:hypothetical protein BH11ACT8_BH11ACT8_17270 [soil metagenome]
MTLFSGTLSRFARSLSLVVAIAAVAIAGLTVVGAPAQASTGAIKPCTAHDMSQGHTYRKVTLTDRSFKMTHAFRKRIPRGVNFTRTVTMESQTVITASMKLTASVKADAGAFFAKASVEAGVEVAGSGSKTSKDTVSEVFDIPKSSMDRLFVFYAGNDTFQFRVQKRYCQQGNVIDTKGTLGSFRNIEESGAVLCPHSRYRAGSDKYRIARDAGC